LIVVLLVSFAVVAAAMTATALVARRVGRVSVVDVTWGAGFILMALVALVVGDGDLWRRWLMLVLVSLGGGRLAWHILRRQLAHPEEDPRYAAMLGDGGFALAVRKVFVVQGLAIWLISAPVQVAGFSSVAYLPLVWVGVALWVVGMVFETVGDAQLAAYKADPERPPVMDRGLWGWTRHPNYFGDACVWWGLWVTGALASGWLPGLLTVVAPLAMTYFLVFATGARLLERTMMKRPGYPAYAARTSMFFPLPPRRPASPRRPPPPTPECVFFRPEVSILVCRAVRSCAPSRAFRRAQVSVLARCPQIADALWRPGSRPGRLAVGRLGEVRWTGSMPTARRW
jgi:steroid 5-alpha reductase family enzyme